jgi:hypothetical protein
MVGMHVISGPNRQSGPGCGTSHASCFGIILGEHTTQKCFLGAYVSSFDSVVSWAPCFPHCDLQPMDLLCRKLFRFVVGALIGFHFFTMARHCKCVE